MNVHLEKIARLFSDIRNERRTCRYVITIDACKGGIARLEIGKGERVPNGVNVLMGETGSFVVVPDNQ